MDEDVEFSGWEPPPLEDDPDREPPPERPPYSGVSIGSDLVGLLHAGSGALDLGEFVCNDLVSVRPTVVGLARLDRLSLTLTKGTRGRVAGDRAAPGLAGRAAAAAAGRSRLG